MGMSWRLAPEVRQGGADLRRAVLKDLLPLGFSGEDLQ